MLLLVLAVVCLVVAVLLPVLAVVSWRREVRRVSRPALGVDLAASDYGSRMSGAVLLARSRRRFEAASRSGRSLRAAADEYLEARARLEATRLTPV